MSKVKILICAVSTVIVFATHASAQKKKCMFIGAAPGEEHGEVNGVDADMIKRLEEWGYVIDKKHTSKDIPQYTEADYKPYDFIFLSESLHSNKMSPLKNIPLPMLNSDGVAAREGALDFASGSPTNIVEPGKPVVFLDKVKNHPLAAGYAPGTVVELGLLDTRQDCLIVWGKPSVDIIPIASMESNPEELVLYGIEKGTKNTSGYIIPNRVATVGMHCFCYRSLTESGIKVMKAGIEWILEDKTTSIEVEKMGYPAYFNLSRNYTNSIFSITYFLTEKSQAKLTVWNKLGQNVQTLVDDVKMAGEHSVDLDASNMPGGMYFFNLEVGNARYSKKIPLIL